MNCIPRGFYAAAVKAGISSHPTRRDLALFYSRVRSSAAGIFTRNKVQAAPVIISRKHLKKGHAQALLINAGCANAATGKAGFASAEKTARWCAKGLSVPAGAVLLASTGVIGEQLPLQKMQKGIGRLVTDISSGRAKAFQSAARAIMTTDTTLKTVSRQAGNARIWACAKGSGMIHPDMATMLAFFLTDARLSPSSAKQLLKQSAEKSFNRISVDGDTSTNDSVFFLANGCAGESELAPGRPGWEAFAKTFDRMAEELSTMIAADGEGARHLIRIDVERAATRNNAFHVAQTVATSPLVKTAVGGADPNWGRILAAVGSSGIPLDPARIDIFIGNLRICRKGTAVRFSEREARRILRRKEVRIRILLNQGSARDGYWTCDLTSGYIRINAHYRT